MFLKLLGIFAEFERDRMSERRTEAAQAIKAAGNWNGGTPPFGWQAVPNSKGWKLAKDPKHFPVLEQVIEMAEKSASLNAIAAWLNGKGIPSPMDVIRIRYGKEPRNVGWKPQSVRTILTASGVPVPDTGRKQGPKKSGMLLHITFCAQCNGPLYLTSYHGRRYYRCRNATPARGAREKCPVKLIPAAEIASKLDEWFRDHPGYEITETVVVKGSDRRAELLVIRRQMARAAEDRSLSADDYQARIAELRAQLDAIQPVPARIVRKPTGRYVKDEWPTSDEEKRRKFLLDNGFRVEATRGIPEESGVVIIPGQAYEDKALA